MKEVVISRRWVQIVNYRSERRCWTYDYAFNGGRPPAVKIEYGTALSSLRSVLRHKYPDHKIIQSWEKS